MIATVTSVTDLICIANTVRSEWNGELWWRGQSSTQYDLIPGVYRANQGTRGEQNLCLRFRQYAQSRHDTCPPQEDFCSWLFLAQHYGLPTRLLDWSESALVGLFFAANANPSLDASIYVLHPREMNRVTNGDHTLVPVTSRPASDLFRGAFDDRVTETKTVAVLPHECDKRMLVQQGAFTLHGSSQDLREIVGHDSVIRTFTVPSESKPGIIEELASLGIRQRTLLPDLANLAADLKNLVFSEIGVRTA